MGRRKTNTASGHVDTSRAKGYVVERVVSPAPSGTVERPEGGEVEGASLRAGRAKVMDYLVTCDCPIPQEMYYELVSRTTLHQWRTVGVGGARLVWHAVPGQGVCIRPSEFRKYVETVATHGQGGGS